MVYQKKKQLRQDDKKKKFLIIILLPFIIFMLILSVRGHINVYLLKNSEMVEATVINTDIASGKHHHGSKSVTYKFYINGNEYIGESATIKLRNYETDESILIYYNKHNPNNNGTMEINTILLAICIGMLFMSIYSLKQMLQDKGTV